jgi:putative SOS response-associated peptidase YedK
MCGRFDQSQTARFYANVFGWLDAVIDSEASPAANVPPGTYRPLLHLVDGQARVDDLFWSYRAKWAEDKLPISINARLDKLGNRYWSRLLKHGRAVVPADGWYEWTGEKGHKQAWHIHRKDGAPLFMLALANFGPFTTHRAEAGFVLVTDAADEGLLAIHDRRPVVLEAADAALWLDPDITPEQACELARRSALPAHAFAWNKVTPDVNRPAPEAKLAQSSAH